MSSTVSVTGRGVHPNIRRAFSDETGRRFPNSNSRPRTIGSNSATIRATKSGAGIEGTFFALSPGPCLSILATSEPTGFTQVICHGRLHNRRAWTRGGASHRPWFWVRRLVVAVPAAEAGGDPCEPREGAARVRVLLPRCFSFHGGADGGGGFDRAFVDHVGCRAGPASRASVS